MSNGFRRFKTARPIRPAATVPTAIPSTGTSVTRLGAWALIALLLPLPFSTACSGVTVAQDIVNWTPTLQSAVATVDSTAALLAPMDAPIFTAATVGFDVASNLLVTQAKAYLANPSGGLLAQIQTQIVTFQQQVNSLVGRNLRHKKKFAFAIGVGVHRWVQRGDIQNTG